MKGMTPSAGYPSPGPAGWSFDRISDHHVVKFVALLVGFVAFFVATAFSIVEHYEIGALQAELKKSEYMVQALSGEFATKFELLQKAFSEASLGPKSEGQDSVAYLESVIDAVQKKKAIIEQIDLAGAASKNHDFKKMIEILQGPLLVGLPATQRILGMSYSCGCGVKPNPVLAREYMTKAANGGDADAIAWLKQHQS